MATAVARGIRARTTAPDLFERVLSIGALILLAALTIAIVKGRADWAEIEASIWLHLATIALAVGLTPVMLLRRRGDRLHRRLGWVWVAAMLTTAIATFFIRRTNPGGFSVIHLLSAWTIVQVPIIVWSARTHNVVRHRGAVRGMVTGALLIAGFFTFPFDRLLGHWLFG